MMIARFEQHRSLCDEIIQQQRTLISDNNISCPKELDEIYELYLQEMGDIALDRKGSLPDLHLTKVE